MKLRIIKIGKPAIKDYKALVDEYQGRIKRYVNFESVEIKAEDGREKNPENLKKVLLGQSKDRGKNILICLDERGDQWTSEELAKKIGSWQSGGVQSASFLIGGPYGIAEDIRSQADDVWCLSKGVFPSDLAWLTVSEQVYRAFTILGGQSYHHY